VEQIISFVVTHCLFFTLVSTPSHAPIFSKDMKVGGKRTIRIPPSLAYGDDWFKGVIPPSSHLQFECELQSIAQSPQEEFMVQLQDFGVARAAGMAVLGAYLAISPMLG
jgi:FKBP-type peptidyl-prolyl cis-trans isomerase